MNKANQDAVLSCLLNPKENEIYVPDSIKIMSLESGEIENGNRVTKWIKFACVSVEELEKLASVGLEENANEIKMKVSGYQGEDFGNLIGAVLETSDLAIEFDEQKRGNRSSIAGLCFRANMNDLKKAV